MATYFARKAGNINATDVWATTPSGTAGAVTFVAGDVLMANSFAVTINVSTDLGATGQVRNDTTGGATAGGSFTLSNGVTLTANVFGGSTATVATVVFSGTSGNSAQIVGNCLGGSVSNSFAANNTSSGVLNITGSCTGGTNGAGVNNNSTGTINITGTCTGGTFNPGAQNNSTGTMNITGNCLGSAGTNSTGATNVSTGTLNITGTCTGGTSGPGAINASTGTMLIDGVIQASETVGGVGGSYRAQVTLLTGPFLISPTFGVNPIGCLAWRWASALNNQTYIEVGTQTLLQKRNLVTPDNATNFPAASNVRSGITYGIGGVVSGTCIVPNPAQVAAGTPVDNTVGTLSTPSANDIQNAVWGAATSSLTTAGSIGERLKNASTVASTGDQLASALTAP